MYRSTVYPGPCTPAFAVSRVTIPYWCRHPLARPLRPQRLTRLAPNVCRRACWTVIATPSRMARARFVLSARNACSMTRVARRNPDIGRYQTLIHVEQRADRTVSDGMGLDAPASPSAHSPAALCRATKARFGATAFVYHRNIVSRDWNGRRSANCNGRIHDIRSPSPHRSCDEE